jgi:hypothetical protein
VDTLASHVLTGVVSFAVALALIWLSPKAKLVWWSPHLFRFDLVLPQGEGNPTVNASLYTHAITIQNIGRRAAEGIEIIHSRKPDLFRLQPARDFTESTNPQGSHVLHLNTLGPKEWFTIEFLSYTLQPETPGIRSNAGMAQLIPIGFNRVLPRWKICGIWLLIFSGIGLWAYWLIRTGEFVLGARLLR